MAGVYDIQTLIGVVRDLRSPQSFLLDTFFPNVVESAESEIAIDVEIATRRLAPFVSPLVEGRLVQAPGQETKFFKPAYIKAKTVPDLRAPLRRRVGETIGSGSSSPAEREGQIVAAILADHVAMINRRLEWMAASALRTGTVTVAGDGYPTVVVNFQRDAALTVALAGAARWGQTGVKPLQNIEDWATLVLQKSGAVPTDVVFTPGAWRLFKDDGDVKAAIQSPNQTDVNIRLAGTVAKGAAFVGTVGMFRLWVYNEFYVDPADGAEKALLPDGTVLLGSADIEGNRVFGAIQDPAFAYGAMAYAPKSWVEHDPAQRFVMTQSAPLVVPFRPNASFAATVI